MPGYVGDPLSPNTSSSEFDFVPFSASSPAATGRNSLISYVISSMLLAIQYGFFFIKVCSSFFYLCRIFTYFLLSFGNSKDTLYNVILRIARNFLKTRENIKISTHPVYHINLDWEWSKKLLFFFEKKIKMADSKKLSFSTLPVLNIFFQKFHGLVLDLVE